MILLDDIEERIYYGRNQSVSYDEMYRFWKDSVKTECFHSLFNNLPRQMFVYDKIVEELDVKISQLERLPEPQEN